MRFPIALLLLALAAPVFAGDRPSIVQDGRTWVWSDGLGMYAPSGVGWHYDVDRGVFWRQKSPTITYRGETWAWDETVGQYRPPGGGWQWDGSQWWRYRPEPPRIGVPLANCGT